MFLKMLLQYIYTTIMRIYIDSWCNSTFMYVLICSWFSLQDEFFCRAHHILHNRTKLHERKLETELDKIERNLKTFIVESKVISAFFFQKTTINQSDICRTLVNDETCNKLFFLSLSVLDYLYRKEHPGFERIQTHHNFPGKRHKLQQTQEL